MVDVTLIIPTMCIDTFIPTCSRILTSNLEYNKKINPTYSFKPETEIVLHSCHSISDLAEVHEYLKKGHKVVMGGPFCFIFDNKQIREKLIEMGEVNTDNLIVVKGYISKKTNLYEIIREWRDCEVDEDITSIWECEDDCLLEYSEKFNLKDLCAIYVMDSKCSHGKCRYCSYRKLNKMKHHIDVDVVANHINTMVEKYKSDKVFLADNTFMFTEKNLELLEKIKHNKIMVFSTVKQLCNISNIEYMNKYINRITVGLESFVDFSLNHVNKGYGSKDVLMAIKNIVKYMKRDMILYLNIITDLPVSSIDEIHFQYRMLQKVNDLLLSEGFEVEWHIYKLFIGFNLEMVDNKYIKIIRKVGKDICWRKFDKNGNMLPEDCEIFDVSSIKNSLVLLE